METTRERSIWAWGWRDKFPDANARTGIAQLVQLLVPSVKPASRALPPEAPDVPDAKIAVPAVRERLTEAIERELEITESRTA